MTVTLITGATEGIGYGLPLALYSESGPLPW